MAKKPKSRAGRPKSPVGLNRNIGIQITDAEDACLLAEQQRTGLSRTQVILQRLFSGPRDNPQIKPIQEMQ